MSFSCFRNIKWAVKGSQLFGCHQQYFVYLCYLLSIFYRTTIISSIPLRQHESFYCINVVLPKVCSWIVIYIYSENDFKWYVICFFCKLNNLKSRKEQLDCLHSRLLSTIQERWGGSPYHWPSTHLVKACVLWWSIIRAREQWSDLRVWFSCTRKGGDSLQGCGRSLCWTWSIVWLGKTTACTQRKHQQ